MKKSKIVTIIILVVVLLVGGFFLYLGNHKISINQITTNEPKELNPEVLGNKDDLVSFSLKPNDYVNMETEITGTVKGGYFFEGNILVNILDANKKLLRSGHATAMGEWMTAEPVKFQGDIDFIGLSKGPAYIEIHNDNASGLPVNDKSILIPVIIK
jgi:hypothetical protein